jgi:hypothetical protein
MAKFFEECVRLKKRRRSAEMYHWRAIALTPLTGMRYVLDNTLAWRALSGRGVDYDATGKFSKVVETRKKKAYAPVKAREEARWRRKIRFIPLAFEISGGWGEEMAKFFEECAWLKKWRRSVEMYHWCARLCPHRTMYTSPTALTPRYCTTV